MDPPRRRRSSSTGNERPPVNVVKHEHKRRLRKQSLPSANNKPKLTMEELKKLRERLAADPMAPVLPAAGKGGKVFPTPQSLRNANIAYCCERRGADWKRDAEGCVLPYPAPLMKEHVFKLTDYATVDEMACNVPEQSNAWSLRELVNFVTRGGPATELAKLRVIFRWIGHQDLNRRSADGKVEKSRQKQPESAAAGEATEAKLTVLEWLDGVRDGEFSYCKLLQEMCKQAGIKCCSIHGYAKSADYEPGDDVISPRFQHEWMAVLLEDAWYLTDPRWASSYIDKHRLEWLLVEDGSISSTDNNPPGKRGKELSLTGTDARVFYSYNEAWFLTDPERMIYTHWPKDEKWQLLARPISENEFKEMAYLKPAFFDYGLQVTETSQRCVLYAADGETEITIQQPRDAKYAFMHKLWVSSSLKGRGEGREEEGAAGAVFSGGAQMTFNGTKLDRFVFVQNVDGRLTCRIQFPVAATFKIDIFCRDLEGSRGKEEEEENWEGKLPADPAFQLVCAYVIHTARPMRDVEALPENHRMEWGPGHDLRDAGLQAVSHRDAGEIVTASGEVELRFKTTPRRDVETVFRLHSNSRNPDELKRYVLQRLENGNELIALVRLPKPGLYAVSLYAAEKDKVRSLPNVCAYVINALRAADDPTPFPDVPNGQIGPTADLERVRLKPLSHPTAFVRVPADLNGEIDVVFARLTAASTRYDFVTKLTLHRKDSRVPADDMIFVADGEDHVTFRVRFQRPGQHLFQIHGRIKDAGGSLPLLFSYVFQVAVATTKRRAFPKQYGPWPTGAELYEPTGYVRDIAAHRRTVRFDVRLPGAVDVATIVGGKAWTKLGTRRGAESDRWSGDVEVAGVTAGCEIQLSAKYDSKSTGFTTILVFKLVDDVDLALI